MRRRQTKPGRTSRRSTVQGEPKNATELLRSGRACKLEWVEVADRCDGCGARMAKRTQDVTLSRGRVTLHRVPLFRCGSCGRVRLADRFKDSLPELARELVELLLQTG